MKHTLVAAAILASFFAGSASAQSSVTVYGLLDAGLTSEHGGAEGSVTKLATGVQSGSRIGFKGTEDLGNNLKVNFLLEMALTSIRAPTARAPCSGARPTWACRAASAP